MAISFDTKKLNSFFASHYAELCGMAARRSKNSPFTSAESLVNSAYSLLRDSKSAPITDESHLKNWLGRMFLHKSIDKQRRETKSEPLPESLEQRCRSLGPELDVQRYLEALRRELPRVAEVIEQYYFEDCTVKNIAQRVGISERTVRSILRTGEAWIRHRLSAGA